MQFPVKSIPPAVSTLRDFSQGRWRVEVQIGLQDNDSVIQYTADYYQRITDWRF